MKAIQIANACLFAAIAGFASFGAQAADSQPVEQYHYGQKLDVKRVLAIHEESASPFDCGIVNARMDYLDSSGQPHSLAYRKFATDCNEGG
ncbi:hypothetical protein HNP46_001419 [Pseudomonas nitritireducens]|uniref:DUF2790 domain-containing protein n=1 Tax=Pseudomonas nitroreducens TaxID=46680 RepID=A0A7W7KHG0_PSENT|nr:DUF2790 domain-containing protein [Pseudomonas nitritireducens]MBB4862575.1 hypothetical protein [Pseudomonas nitritireducens]